MEFFDIRAGVAKTGSRPVIRATDKTVIISIPRDLAEGCGLDKSKTAKIQFGQADDKAAVRVSPDPAGKWKVRQSKKLLTLYIPELVPAAASAPAESDFDSDASAITITLPSPWRLANGAVLVRPNGKRPTK